MLRGFAHRRIRIKVTDERMSPAVCGLFRPVILLPRTLAEKLSAEQLRAVLLHELFHLRRRDVWVNCAQALLQIAYWWHPLLWLANARIRRLREEAVDDAVMLTLGNEADSYAPTLLEVAKLALQRPLLSLGLVGIMESRSALRQRIERLVNFRAPHKAGLTLVSLCVICIFSAVALPMGQGPAPALSNGPAIVHEPEPRLASGRGENRISLPAYAAPMPAAAEPSVLVMAEFYQLNIHERKNTISTGTLSSRAVDIIHSNAPGSGVTKLSTSRVVTRCGTRADFVMGNETNRVLLSCVPTLEGNSVRLTMQGLIVTIS
ncbi:MAG TPA: M56 family metallopeptidase [Verrucomicrobiae bacterium]